MYIQKIDKKQSFRGFNYSNVSMTDRICLQKDFSKLLELGKKYNIKLTSTYSDIPDFSAIDIDVTPLRKNLRFWRKFFPPIGRSTFQTNPENTEASLLDSVYNAIKDLTAKTGKGNY